MANTYEAIATQTLSSNQTTITFSSIPSTYTDLVLIAFNQDTRTGGNDLNMQFNGDTASNYSITWIRGNGTSATSARQSTNFINVGSNAGSNQSYYATTIINIMNYSNTTTYKTILARGNAALAQTIATVGLWRSTSAINSISFNGGGYDFTTGSTFSLYGIKAA